MSQLRVNTVTDVSGTGSTYAPGHVVQVVSVSKTDTFSTSTNAFVDVPGMAASITPKFATSKILVTINTYAGHTDIGDILLNMVRGSTTLFQGDGAGIPSTFFIRGQGAATIDNATSIFLDTPNITSSITYKLQIRVLTQTASINRRGADLTFVPTSTITLMEIAQ
jgi:GTPase Era involved in 16S rRNA processing